MVIQINHTALYLMLQFYTMSNTFSTMGLHLRYRLWIAELNADTTLLRIFDDYIAELATKNEMAELTKGITHFKVKFMHLRTESDTLKHEMHLVKMKLAALSKKAGEEQQDASIQSGHALLEKNYTDFRETFNTTQKEFVQFADEWLK